MIVLETKNKKTNLVLRTRKIADIAKKLEGKNFEDVYFKALNELNVESLSQIIYLLGEDEDKRATFKNVNEVYDFLDDYKEENKKTYVQIFESLTEAINEEGFFNSKMTKTELKEKMSNPLSTINMNELVKQSAEKAITQITEKEFQGYRA